MAEVTPSVFSTITATHRSTSDISDQTQPPTGGQITSFNYSFNVFSDWDLIFTTYTLNKTEEINICIFVKMEVFRFDVGLRL